MSEHAELSAQLEDIIGSLSIDESLVVDEMMRYPAIVARVNFMHAEAVAAEIELKTEVERAVANAVLDRTAALGKVTRQVMDAHVALEGNVMDARDRYNEAQARTRLLRAAVDTLHSKREMLVSIGMRLNTEMRMDPMKALQARQDR